MNNPQTPSGPEFASGPLGTFYVTDSGTKLTVLREIAPILVGFAIDFHTSVEALDPAHCYGDPHGDGIHLNVHKHPPGVGATFSTRQILSIGKLMDKWSWGGRSLLWWGLRDPGIQQAYIRLDVARDIWEPAITLLQTPVPPGVNRWPQLPYTGEIASRTLRLRQPRMAGEDVRWLHYAVGVAGGPGDLAEVTDGVYGPSTAMAVSAYQLGHGLEADGVVGPLTWATLIG